MPPATTSMVESRTPAWSSLASRRSIASSSQAGRWGGGTGSDPAVEAIDDHLEAEQGDHDGEDHPEECASGRREHPGAYRRAGEDAENHGHREPGIDVAPGQVDPGARGGGHPD